VSIQRDDTVRTAATSGDQDPPGESQRLDFAQNVALAMYLIDRRVDLAAIRRSAQ
jgi:hypothetical protein